MVPATSCSILPLQRNAWLSRTELKGTTHLVYAALYEEPNLVDGWRDPKQIAINDNMLRNLMARSSQSPRI